MSKRASVWSELMSISFFVGTASARSPHHEIDDGLYGLARCVVVFFFCVIKVCERQKTKVKTSSLNL